MHGMDTPRKGEAAKAFLRLKVPVPPLWPLWKRNGYWFCLTMLVFRDPNAMN